MNSPVLKEYQRDRLTAFIDPENTSEAAIYNVEQSKQAIASGRVTGQGLFEGPQTNLGFVPEQETDFIFTTVGEEWGFIGSVVVLALLCAMILRLMKMGERQQEPFRRVYCYSVAAIFLFHTIINIGMTIGLMPVIGIPLPMFSYGGSSLLSFTILFFIAVRLDSQNSSIGATYKFR
jgi:rod shape determining protein RodA